MKKESENYLELSKLTFKNSKERKNIQESLSRISESLRDMRVEKGFSQEELAELASVSLATIKFIEQKQRSPSLAMLFKILYALDKTIQVKEK